MSLVGFRVLGFVGAHGGSFNDPHAASGWRIHCGVEVTELSTNKQHSLSINDNLSDGHMFMFRLMTCRWYQQLNADPWVTQSRIVLPLETGEQPSLSSGLSDAHWLNRRRPGSLCNFIEYE